MKRLMTVIVLALAVSAATAAPAAAASGGFAGAWVALDLPGDGSVQLLTIGGAPHPGVTYQDMFASVCANNNAPSTHFIAPGMGEMNGDVLVVTFPRGGGCGSFRDGVGDLVLVHDAATDTLSDGTFTWTRSL